jgi:hypothetical protein
MAIKTFTTGEVLTASDTNTYLANSGLVYIKEQTIGTGVSTVTVNAAFSADFDNYKIIISGGVGSAAQFLRLQIGAAAAAYYAGFSAVNYGTNLSENSVVNNGAIFSNAGIMDTSNINMNVEVQSPFLTKPTYVSGSIATSGRAGAFAGVLSNSTSYTSFVMSPTSGTMTGGTITVYGFRKA